jgi:ribulose-phosphate 3-epimerase
MTIQIIPTIFAQNKEEFQSRLDKLLPFSSAFQIDFMDGIFVKSKSIALIDIPNLKKYKKDFEAHLMLFAPEDYLFELKNKGFSKILFHIETVKSPKKIIQKIQSLKMKAFLALNPQTPLEEILQYISIVDGILIMGVHPGKEHQTLIKNTLVKITKLRSFNKKIPIQIDGGVNIQVAKQLYRAGASILNTGSYTANSKNPKIAIKKIKEIIG